MNALVILLGLLLTPDQKSVKSPIITPDLNPSKQEVEPSVIEAPLEDPELKNLEWNRYVTKNFTILSIDNERGKLLAENIEAMKASALVRWGFPDVTFTKECRVFCVPSYSLLKKFFNINSGRVQSRKDLNVIWFVLDDKPSKAILPLITQIALNEYEIAQKTILPFWFKRGAFILNGPVADIRQELTNFNDIARKEQFTHTAEQMLVSTEEEYNKQSAENKKIYDEQAVCLCLLLRKEFGEVKLQGFLRILSRNKPDIAIAVVYFFKDLASLDKSYVRFMKDLSADIVRNETPDSYLIITPVQK